MKPTQDIGKVRTRIWNGELRTPFHNFVRTSNTDVEILLRLLGRINLIAILRLFQDHSQRDLFYMILSIVISDTLYLQKEMNDVRSRWLSHLADFLEATRQLSWRIYNLGIPLRLPEGYPGGWCFCRDNQAAFMEDSRSKWSTTSSSILEQPRWSLSVCPIVFPDKWRVKKNPLGLVGNLDRRSYMEAASVPRG